jgi:protein-S-isoprenylcysteine O-methyltransferase Ste14
LADEKAGDKRLPFRQHRQNGFPDSSVRPVLFLHGVCRGIPFADRQPTGFFQSETISWVGIFLCLAGLFLLFLSLVSFGKSFRVGIDRDHPDELVTTGIFGFSRNPIYVAFWVFLLGQFLVFPNWILLVYLVAAAWLFHRQVLREEEYMRNHYGQQYLDYCNRVRRYL